MMSFKEFMELIKTILLDWRVIVTVVVMLFTVSMANKIINYRKRPKRNKKRKGAATPTPAPAPQPKAEETDEEN